jgi:hypothetical protein
MARRLVLWMMLVLGLAVPASAQLGGDFCVRAYEDLNGSGVRDTGDGATFEPLLRAGIGADLLNEDGIVIASALLADSPTAEQGVICFQFLPDGQYTIQITSAEYRATTPDTMTAGIRSGELPAVMELGVRSALETVALPSTSSVEPADEPTPNLERLLMAAAAGIGAALVMQLLGLLIYVVRFGRRRKPADDATATFRPPVS